VPNLPSEPLPETESKSEELKTLPPSQPIPPEGNAVEREEDYDVNIFIQALFLFDSFSFYLNSLLGYFFDSTSKNLQYSYKLNP
jgi:hypothetical protein